MQNYKNKVVLIIGATGGIGSELSRQFSERGAKLVLFSKNESKLKNLKSSLNSPNISILGDARNYDDLESAVKTGIKEFGQIDVLVHAVGSIVLKSIQNLSLDEFREILDINLTSPFLAIKSVIP